jgi:hypothetical protein
MAEALTESQKLLLFNLQLKDIGADCYLFNLNDGFNDFTLKKGWFATEKIIGQLKRVDKRYKYFMFGCPKTNEKIISSLKEYFGIELEIFVKTDYPVNRLNRHLY